MLEQGSRDEVRIGIKLIGSLVRNKSTWACSKMVLQTLERYIKFNYQRYSLQYVYTIFWRTAQCIYMRTVIHNVQYILNNKKMMQ